MRQREHSTERVRQREEHPVYSLPLLFQLREEDDKCEVPGFARQRGASGDAEAADMSERDTPMSEMSKISESGGDPHFLSLSGGAEAAELLLYMCRQHTSAYVSDSGGRTAIYVPPPGYCYICAPSRPFSARRRGCLGEEGHAVAYEGHTSPLSARWRGCGGCGCRCGGEERRVD